MPNVYSVRRVSKTLWFRGAATLLKMHKVYSLIELMDLMKLLE